jgi:adenine-specific DNA-methyltransferase
MEGETQSSINAELHFGERVLPTLDNNIKDGNSIVNFDYYDSKLELEKDKKIKAFSWKMAFPDIFEHGGFDVVIGNPPYVFGRDWKALGIGDDVKNYLSQKFASSAYQLDMFSIFMEQAFNLVKHKGMIGFIVPNVWLNNSYSASTRHFVLAKSQHLEIITPKEKVFPDVTVDTIIYISKKGKGLPQNELVISKLGKSGVETFLSLKFDKYFSGKETISTSNSDAESSIIEKIGSTGEPLSDVADITRGIHPYRTGGYGTSAFVKGPQIQKDVDERPYHNVTRLAGYRPFVYGKDLRRFTPIKSKEFVKYGKWLAEPRDPAFFEGTRIYSRKILGDKLVVTIEEEDSIADQQVYITRPKYEDCGAEYIAAIMGSKLMAFYIKKYFNEENDDFPQIKVGQLKSLPIRRLDPKDLRHTELKKNISSCVATLMSLNKQIGESKLQSKIESITRHLEYCEQQIDKMVFELYNLTQEEIEIISTYS